MKLQLNIHYITYGSQVLMMSGNTPETGLFDENNAISLTPSGDGVWKLELDVRATELFEYRYLIRSNGQTERREWGENHTVVVNDVFGKSVAYDSWQAEPDMSFLYTSAYTDSLLKVEPESSVQPHGRAGRGCSHRRYG